MVEAEGGDATTNVLKISFSPSTTYGNFVGEYRPTMVYKESGTDTFFDETGEEDGEILGTPMIMYRYVQGKFLQAYSRAISEENEGRPVVLLIDEVNRGDIYEIFGEVFQLMERNDEGIGVYQ